MILLERPPVKTALPGEENAWYAPGDPAAIFGVFL